MNNPVDRNSKGQAERGSGVREEKLLTVCESCPWLRKNHGKPHPAKWYSTANLRRLWNGLRSGKAPGMMCHATDPHAASYGGSANIKPGREHACAGALLLMVADMNDLAAGRPQRFQPPLSRWTIADLAWRHLTRTLPAVEDRVADVGLPWQSPLSDSSTPEPRSAYGPQGGTE